MELMLNITEKMERVQFKEPQKCKFHEANTVFIEGRVFINGRSYDYWLNMYLVNGEWVTYSEHYKHMNNGKTYSYWYHDITLQGGTRNAKQKCREYMPILLNKALKKTNTSDLQLEAERKHLEHQMDQAERAVADAEEALRDAQEKLAVLQNKYGNLLFREVV